MSLLKQAENTLADLFKGAPKLSKDTKDTLVKVLPWLALIGGLVNLWSALSAYRWANMFKDTENFFTAIGAPQVVQNRWSVWVWIAIIVGVIQGVILILAFTKLQKKAKAGWDMLLLSGLIGVAYSVFSVFFDGFGYGGGGFVGLVFGLIVSAVVFWLLFSVRDMYHGADFKLSDVKDSAKDIAGKNKK